MAGNEVSQSETRPQTETPKKTPSIICYAASAQTVIQDTIWYFLMHTVIFLYSHRKAQCLLSQQTWFDSSVLQEVSASLILPPYCCASLCCSAFPFWFFNIQIMRISSLRNCWAHPKQCERLFFLVMILSGVKPRGNAPFIKMLFCPYFIFCIIPWMLSTCGNYKDNNTMIWLKLSGNDDMRKNRLRLVIVKLTFSQKSPRPRANSRARARSRRTHTCLGIAGEGLIINDSLPYQRV